MERKTRDVHLVADRARGAIGRFGFDQLREEGGVDVEPLDFLGVWIDRYGGNGSAQTTLNLYWTARIVGGALEPADDVAEFRWFAPDEVDENELAFAHTREVLSVLRQ